MEILVTALIVGLVAVLTGYALFLRSELEIQKMLFNIERGAVDDLIKDYERVVEKLTAQMNEPTLFDDLFDDLFDGQDIYDTDEEGNCLGCGSNHYNEDWPAESFNEWNEIFNNQKGEDIVVTDAV
jgi:hypothetical protein